MTVPGETVAPDRPKRSVGLAMVVGTALEFFDFTLYASMSALVLGRVFFPSVNPVTGTIAAVATFGAGFIMRPLGGIVFGALGDRIGRKKVLILSFVLMGAASGFIGLLPGYAVLGVAAPILLLVLRLLQGLGAGAEQSTAITASYEHADAGRRGRFGAWPALGGNIGLLAASATIAVLAAFGDEFLLSWGWRIPFVASFALVAFGVWVRRDVPETPVFEEVKTHSGRARRPLLALVRGHWPALIVVGALTFGYNAASYVFKTFSLAYLTEYQDMPASVGTTGLAIASSTAILTVLVVGRLGDRVDPRTLSIIGGVLVAVLAFPFFLLLGSGNPGLVWIAMVLATGMVIPLCQASSMPLMARQFPPEVRASGLGAGREFPGAVAGGLAPVGALALVTASPTNSSSGVAAAMVGFGLVLVGAAWGAARLRDGAGPGTPKRPVAAGSASVAETVRS